MKVCPAAWAGCFVSRRNPEGASNSRGARLARAISARRTRAMRKGTRAVRIGGMTDPTFTRWASCASGVWRPGADIR